MDNHTIRHAIDSTIEQMPLAEQVLVLNYARSLKSSKGKPGSTLLPFLGTMPADIAEEISQTIELGCEKVDPNDW